MDKTKIQALAEKYGLAPSKSKGQNFLFNEDIVEKIVAGAGVGPNSLVLEIGPGFGILTEHLLKTAKKVLAVELDKKAIEYMKLNFSSAKNFELAEGDILKMKNQEIFDRLGGEYEVVANIPYNITSPIIRKFLNYDPKPRRLTLLVQDEVAQRLAAKPGALSILGISAQLYAEVEYLFKVDRENFWPQPEVQSAVIQLRWTDKNLVKLKCDEDRFFQIVKFGFAAKRKKLANNLGAGMRIKPSVAAVYLKELGFDVNIRAQELSVDDWIRLANKICDIIKR